MQLQITKEKVLEAANKCGQAKETLKTLFPEVFEDNKYFDLSKLRIKADKADDVNIFTDKSSIEAGFDSGSFFQIRSYGNFKNKGFYLDKYYNWEIIKDNTNILCLVPTKK